MLQGLSIRSVMQQETQPSRSKEMQAKSMRTIKTIRALSVVAGFMHYLITLGLLFMGFKDGPVLIPSPNGVVVGVVDDLKNGSGVEGKFSVTIAGCAFGSLVTCIWASVGAWETHRGSNGSQLPSWEWHNCHFAKAVNTVFAVTFFLWPALVIFTLHSLGDNFWSLVLGLEDVNTTELFPSSKPNPSLTAVCISHMLIFFLVFIVQSITILYSTKKLKQYQTEVENAGEEIEIDSTEDSLAPPRIVKFLAASKLITDCLFAIDLIVLATTAKQFNSSTMFSLIVQLGFLLLDGYLSRSVFAAGQWTEKESWITTWREMCVAHLFIAWVIFCVTFSIYLIDSEHDTGFWTALARIEERGIWVGAAIGVWLLLMGVYISLFFKHHSCMSALDEISSLRLIERLNEKKDNRTHSASVSNTNMSASVADDGSEDNFNQWDSDERRNTLSP